MNATTRINRQAVQVRILVAPERTDAGDVRLYVGVDQVIDLPGATADELAHLLTLYRAEQKDQVQS